MSELLFANFLFAVLLRRVDENERRKKNEKIRIRSCKRRMQIDTATNSSCHNGKQWLVNTTEEMKIDHLAEFKFLLRLKTIWMPSISLQCANERNRIATNGFFFHLFLSFKSQNFIPKFLFSTDRLPTFAVNCFKTERFLSTQLNPFVESQMSTTRELSWMRWSNN